MTTLVFLGPSLDRTEAKHIYPDATYLPPVACGDIVKVINLKPERIVIIDGYFHYTAAVWHKEILYALDSGIEVYGASSMGALRAAELYQFGMQGFGKIFNDFKSGVLQDDDEVAVLHASKKLGYVVKTDAMVNIRETLMSAYQNNLLTLEGMNCLIEKLKNTFYQKRNLFKELASYCEHNSCDQFELLTWMKENYIDQKKQDAQDLLNYLAKNDTVKRMTIPNFNKTCYFTQLLSGINKQP